METEDFVVSGTCSEQMYGMCESLWEPDMVSLTPPNGGNGKIRSDGVCVFLNAEKKNALGVKSVRPAVKCVTWDCCQQEPEDLFETISQAMLNAVDRDAVSGMGVVVHVM